jgi:hypothetical protein
MRFGALPRKIVSNSVDPETPDPREATHEPPWIRLPGPDNSTNYRVCFGFVAVALVLAIAWSQVVAGSLLSEMLLVFAGLPLVAAVFVWFLAMIPNIEGFEFQVHPTVGTRFIVGRWAVPRARRRMRGPYQSLVWVHLRGGLPCLMGFDDKGNITRVLSSIEIRQEEATRLLNAAGAPLCSAESWRDMIAGMPGVFESDPPRELGPGAQAARAARFRDASLTFVYTVHVVALAVALRSLYLSIILFFVSAAAVLYAGAPHWRGHLLRVHEEQLMLELHGPFGFTRARRRSHTVPLNEVRFELRHVAPVGNISVEVHRAGEREQLRTILWPLSEMISLLQFCRAWKIAYSWTS